MELFKEEAKKLLSNKLFKILLLIFFILNSVFCFVTFNRDITMEKTYTHNGYKRLYEDLSDLSIDDSLAYVQAISNELYEKRETNYTPKYEKDYTSEYFLILNVEEELKHCKYYAQNTDNIITNAEQLLNAAIPILGNKFAIRNQQQIIKDYSKLQDNVIIKHASAKGIEKLSANKITDFIYIIIILIAVVCLITNERDSGELAFYKSAYDGKLKLALSKLAVLFLFIFALCISLFLYNIIVAGNLFGFGDLKRSIQSIPLFKSSTLKLSVFNYLLYFLASKLINGLLFGSLFYLFAIISKKNLHLYILVISVFSIEIVFYKFIDENSTYNLLKYINLFSFTQISEILAYKNLNIFGLPFLYSNIYLFLSISAVILLTMLSIYIFQAQNETQDEKNHSRNLQRKPLCKGCSLIGCEAYKALICNKCLFVLIIYFIFIAASYKPVWRSYYIPQDIYYEAYIDAVEGEITADKIQYLNQINSAYEDLIYKYENNQISDEIYSYKIQGYDGFCRLYNDKLPYLLDTGGSFIHETGYNILSGNGVFKNIDIKLAFFASTILIYIYSCLYGIEYQNGEYKLLKSSYHGGARTFWVKTLIGTIATVIVYFITYFPIYHDVYERFGFAQIHAPANSMEHLSHLPTDITLFKYLAGVAVIRFIGYILIMLCIFLLSKYTKNIMMNITICLFVIGVPLALVFIGADIAKYLFPNSFILGNVFMSILKYI